MTPDRQILVTAMCPTLADFRAKGAVVNVWLQLKPTPNGPRYDTLSYRLVMQLANMTDLNKRLGNAPNAQPAPEPVRRYEIWCEDFMVASGDY